jgi:hypothetical protein
LLGVLKPAGVPILIFVAPGDSGSKAVLTRDVFAVNTTGLIVMAPTLGSELVTGAETGASPPRKA